MSLLNRVDPVKGLRDTDLTLDERQALHVLAGGGYAFMHVSPRGKQPPVWHLTKKGKQTVLYNDTVKEFIKPENSNMAQPTYDEMAHQVQELQKKLDFAEGAGADMVKNLARQHFINGMRHKLYKAFKAGHACALRTKRGREPVEDAAKAYAMENAPNEPS